MFCCKINKHCSLNLAKRKGLVFEAKQAIFREGGSSRILEM